MFSRSFSSPSVARRAYIYQNNISFPLSSFQNHAITPKFAAEQLNTNFISVCVVYTVALEVQRMRRTPTNKESYTQLLENQHFVIVQENWEGGMASWAVASGGGQAAAGESGP